MYQNLNNSRVNLLKSYAFTYLSQGITVIIFLLTYYFLVKHCSPSEFEKFNLVKRVIPIFTVIISCGMGVGIPRLIANEININLDKISNAISFNIAIVIVLSLLIVIPSFFFEDEIAEILWGTKNYAGLIFLTSLNITALSLFAIVYSIFRGLMFFRTASIFSILNVVFPILGLFLFSNIYAYYLFSVIINFLLFFFALLFLVRKKYYRLYFDFNKIFKDGFDLFKYSFQRVPGDFAYEAIITLPIVFMANYLGPSEASSFSFSINLVTLSTVLLAPISSVLLPYSSHLLSQNKNESLKRHINKIWIIVFGFLFIQLLVIQLWGNYFVEKYFHEKENLSYYFSICSIIVIPSVIYHLVKSPIDSFYEKPIITYLNISCLLLFFILFFLMNILGFGYKSEVAMLIVNILIAILSYFFYLKIFK